MGQFQGKVAAISGAARGQGRALAQRFAHEGANIIALDVCRDIETVPYRGATTEDMEQTVKSIEAIGRRILATHCDVRNAAAVSEAVDAGVAEFGRVDFVLANAGITSFVPAEAMTPEAWDVMIGVNLTGAWNLCRAAIPFLLSQGQGGAIVLTSSTAAHIGLPNLVHYSAAKAGLVGIMQALAVELGPAFIRVNTIHPTAVRTSMSVNQAAFDLFLPGAGLSVGVPGDLEAVAEAHKRLNVMPVAWIEPDDVANAVAFLCSEQAKWITGTQLRVDAGSAVK